MKIINVMKDGTVIDDLTGHVVRYEDCPDAYRVISRINARLAEQNEE